MGDSRFYWSPMLADGAVNVGSAFDEAELETITIPAGSTLCDPDPTGEPSVPVGGTGRAYSVVKGDRGMTVRIRCSLGNDSDLIESFHAMVSFARQGGVVGFALDTDYVWAVQVESDILRGDGDFDYPTSFVEGWEGVTDPESGWRCHVQSPHPQFRRETVKLDTVAGGNATLVEDFVYAYSTQGWNVLVRHKFFFPFLRYLSGDVVLSEPVGGVYFFEAVFEVDVGLEHIPINTVEGHVNDANTLLLLKADADGSGTFIDSSSYARTVTKHGTVDQEAAAAYYGSAGAACGGTDSDYLSVADAAEFDTGTGDFTVEGWARTPDAGNYQVLFWTGNSNTESRRLVVYMDNTGGLEWFWKQGSVVVNNLGNASDPVVADTWFHWCIQREGDNVYIHKNGNLIDSDFGYASVDMDDFTGGAFIGRQDLSGGELPWKGDWDDVRWSNVARYGAGSFTP